MTTGMRFGSGHHAPGSFIRSRAFAQPPDAHRAGKHVGDVGQSGEGGLRCSCRAIQERGLIWTTVQERPAGRAVPLAEGSRLAQAAGGLHPSGTPVWRVFEPPRPRAPSSDRPRCASGRTFTAWSPPTPPACAAIPPGWCTRFHPGPLPVARGPWPAVGLAQHPERRRPQTGGQ